MWLTVTRESAPVANQPSLAGEFLWLGTGFYCRLCGGEAAVVRTPRKMPRLKCQTTGCPQYPYYYEPPVFYAPVSRARVVVIDEEP